jgi:uncharacterized membrane protein
MNEKIINRIIFVLSIAGIIMAVYVLQSFLRQSSIICLTGSGCEAVRKNPAAWPLGIPVPSFGLVGYIILAICSFLRTLNPSSITDHPSPDITTKVMYGVAIFGVCFVSWFTYTELFVIHGMCMWCLISTVVMYVIAGLLLWSRHSTSAQATTT